MEVILGNFHVTDSRARLSETLVSWRYLETEGDALYELIEVLQRRFTAPVLAVKANTLRRPQKRARKPKLSRMSMIF